MRTLTAFVVAPLVPPLLYWAFGPTPMLGSLPGVMSYGAWVGYFAIAIAGVPAYFLITTHSRLRLGHVLGTAVVAGVVTLSLMAGSLEMRTIGQGALYGLSAGVSFWLIWRKNAAQQGRWADSATDKDLAGLTRDSCPFAGERQA